MKTFEDLKFIERKDFFGGSRARCDFENGYSVSVVFGGQSYSNEGTYELAVFKDGEINYETCVTSDVLGWQTPEQITEAMEVLQKL